MTNWVLRRMGGSGGGTALPESWRRGVSRAPGYGLVTLTLKDGKSLSATFDKEDAQQIRLRLPDGKLQTVPRDQIANATPPMSIMPPMLGLLTKPQIRDVVAYLASLKSKKK